MEDQRLIYLNNQGRKSFQWQLWPYCNNNCVFCFLGSANSIYLKDRMLKSLHDLSQAIDNLDYFHYNNISLIGGEFFQGQLNDSTIRLEFFNIFKKLSKLYASGKIGSIWLTATLIHQNQKDLFDLLSFCADYLQPKPEFSSSGLWLCTSWDIKGRFHSKQAEDNWKQNLHKLKSSFPWLKINTTIILQQAFIEAYLAGDFNVKNFMQQYSTNIFYMQPCLQNLTEMMFYKNNQLNIEDFPDHWLYLKQQFNRSHYEFFPKRKDFIAFLNKYHLEDFDSFIKLFNIRFRSDEIHLNLNSENHDRVITRIKDSSSCEEPFPPALDCGHSFNYACYSDSNACAICDRDAIRGL